MAVSRAELGLWTVGSLSLLGAWLLRKRITREAFTNAAIFAGGTLLTAGVMTGVRVRRERGLAGPRLGLSLTEEHGRNGKSLKVWDDPEMGLRERVYLLQGLVASSVKNPDVRKLALAITGHGKREVNIAGDVILVEGAGCPARDEECEAKAIFDWVANPKHVRYTGDVGPHALAPGGPVEAVDEFQSAIRTLEFRGGDCLPLSTLVLRRTPDRGLGRGLPELVSIARLNAGDEIMADGAWTTVSAVWATGSKSILAFELGNGAMLECSPDHRLFAVDEGDLARQQPREVRADQVKPGQYLWTLGGRTVVRSIRQKPEKLCADLTVDRGRFWLPESDVIVHNCDDHGVVNASLGAQNGFPVKFRITSNTGESWDHIYTMFGVPKLNPHRWIAMDTTLGPGKFDKQPARKKQADFAA